VSVYNLENRRREYASQYQGRLKDMAKKKAKAKTAGKAKAKKAGKKR
jgi:hypothetical protein